jgi:hypothetical protein
VLGAGAADPPTSCGASVVADGDGSTVEDPCPPRSRGVLVPAGDDQGTRGVDGLAGASSPGVATGAEVDTPELGTGAAGCCTEGKEDPVVSAGGCIKCLPAYVFTSKFEQILPEILSQG